MEFALWKAVLLGLVQGVTEFLPVSSSGHLVLVQSLLGLQEGIMTFDIFLHFGTLVSVGIAFWPDLKGMILFRPDQRRLDYMILIGTIPTGIIGLACKGLFERVFHSVLIVGVMLLVTGGILWLSEHTAKRRKDLAEMRPPDAFIIGLIQGLAMIPGISRSGSTIVGGLFRGFQRDQAARFSFLLAMPAVFGATLLEVWELIRSGAAELRLFPLAAGTLTAVISGYFAIRFLMRLLKDHSLQPFAYYCWLVGTLIILTKIVEKL